MDINTDLHFKELPANQLNRYYIWIPVFIAIWGGFLFGFNATIIAGAIFYIKREFVLSTLQISILISCTILGAAVGSAVSGRSADYYGRRRILVVTSLIYVFSILASVLANSFWMLVVARTLVGLAIGIVSYVSPLYISELASHKQRGEMVTLNQLFFTLGILCAYFIGYMFAPSHDWRMMFGFGAIPVIFLLFGAFVLPESPRWLVSKNMVDKAAQILQKLRGSPYVLPELNSIVESISDQYLTWRKLLRPWMWPVFFIAFGIAILQQITGIGLIYYYAPIILRYAGFAHRYHAIIAALGVSVVNVVCTFVAIFLLDRWGRRPLLLSGLVLMAIGLIMVGSAFTIGDIQFIANKYMALIGMIVFIIGFAPSLGPITWLLIVEVFPLQIRGVAASIVTSMMLLTNFLVAFTALPLIHLFGEWAFILYAVICAFGFVFVYFFMPETRGVLLEQIEMNLRSGKSCRRLGL